jgi:hypothetical protein
MSLVSDLRRRARHGPAQLIISRDESYILANELCLFMNKPAPIPELWKQICDGELKFMDIPVKVSDHDHCGT